MLSACLCGLVVAGSMFGTQDIVEPVDPVALGRLLPGTPAAIVRAELPQSLSDLIENTEASSTQLPMESLLEMPAWTEPIVQWLYESSELPADMASKQDTSSPRAVAAHSEFEGEGEPEGEEEGSWNGPPQLVFPFWLTPPVPSEGEGEGEGSPEGAFEGEPSILDGPWATGYLMVDMLEMSATIHVEHDLPDVTSVNVCREDGTVVLNIAGAASPAHVELSPTEVEAVFSEMAYIDVRTTSEPNGCVTGLPTISLGSMAGFQCPLPMSSDHVVPQPACATAQANGTLSVWMMGEGVPPYFKVSLDHGFQDALHFDMHTGESDVNGSLLHSWQIDENPVFLIHVFTPLDAMETDPLYFDLHTTACPDGIVRSALEDCPPVRLTRDAPAEYAPGGTIEITAEIENGVLWPGEYLALVETLPEDWVFEGVVSSSAPPMLVTGTCQSGAVGVIWEAPFPASPVVVTYRVGIPPSATGSAVITGTAGVYSSTETTQYDQILSDPVESNLTEGQPGTGAADCIPFELAVDVLPDWDGKVKTYSLESGVFDLFGTSTDKTFDIYPGHEVTLRAIPDPGHDFDGWSGDLFAAAPEIEVAMEGDLSLQAHFAPQGTYSANCALDLPITLDYAGSDPVRALGLYLEIPEGWTCPARAGIGLLRW